MSRALSALRMAEHRAALGLSLDFVVSSFFRIVRDQRVDGDPGQWLAAGERVGDALDRGPIFLDQALGSSAQRRYECRSLGPHLLEAFYPPLKNDPRRMV